MSTSRILKVKQYLSQVNSNEVKKISDDIFKQDDNVMIKNILYNYNQEINKRIKEKKYG